MKKKKQTQTKKQTKEKRIVQVKNNLPTLKQLQDDIETFIYGGDLKAKLNPNQIKLCTKTAQAFGLNPLKREIHFVPFKNKQGTYDISIVVGYETYIQRAESSGKLDGWEVKFEKMQDGDIRATLTIYRKDWSRPFNHEVYLREVQQTKTWNNKTYPTAMWAKMPKFMTRKVAISQGFRLAFPKETGGLPYIPEEIGVGTLDGDKLMIDKKANGPKTNVPVPPKQKKFTQAVVNDIVDRMNNVGTSDEARKIYKEIMTYPAGSIRDKLIAKVTKVGQDIKQIEEDLK